MKLIEGAKAAEGDPEFGISTGRLLPNHRILNEEKVSDATRRTLEQSLVLVHGGMAQDVGPILEMVTEKYLLRSEAEWRGRKEAIGILDEIMEHLKKGEVAQVGQATQRNFEGPIQTIIPWATNLFTETLITKVEEEFGKDFHGFWMLGGMAGGKRFKRELRPCATGMMESVPLAVVRWPKPDQSLTMRNPARPRWMKASQGRPWRNAIAGARV